MLTNSCELSVQKGKHRNQMCWVYFNDTVQIRTAQVGEAKGNIEEALIFLRVLGWALTNISLHSLGCLEGQT